MDVQLEVGDGLQKSHDYGLFLKGDAVFVEV